MAPKGCFENQYEEYSANSAARVINEANNGMSEKFLTKLQSFRASKLTLLATKLKTDIFCDGTVYTGSTGLALYYFMCSLNKDDSYETLKCLVQNNQIFHPRHFLHFVAMETALQYIKLENIKGRKISFLCGDAGPIALATVISYRLGDSRPENLPDYKILAQRLMGLISLLNDSPDELLYGKAGYLYALLFVNKYTKKDLIPPIHIEKVVSAILMSGKQLAAQMKAETPLIWQWHDKVYFGAAHGMAGILYMLLQARLYINVGEIRNFIKPSVDWLLSHQYRSGNFPSSLDSSSGDRLVQWCHGAPGFVPLCLLAYQVLENDEYLKMALKCGDVIWERGLCAKGYSICHGVSGNAYAFLQLYQVTKNPKYLYQACCFMEWCAVERPGTELYHPDRPASLFEGVVGRLYLAQDITRPLEAKFPAMGL